jgi:hypothetical protein
MKRETLYIDHMEGGIAYRDQNRKDGETYKRLCTLPYDTLIPEGWAYKMTGSVRNAIENHIKAIQLLAGGTYVNPTTGTVVPVGYWLSTRLHMEGDSPLRTWIINLAKTYGVTPEYVFLQWKLYTRDQVPESNADYMVFDLKFRRVHVTPAERMLKKFPDMPPRENCLTDMACPECGSRDYFKITMSSVFEMFDDGTGDHEDTEWDGTSACTCGECGHEGTAADFTFEGLDELIEANQKSDEDKDK